MASPIVRPCLIVLVYVYIFADPVKCSWNQQFGKNYYNPDYPSYDPAVSENGVLFLPLTETGVGVYVVAMNTTGEVIWNTAINGPDTCGQSSNLVYSRRFGLVLVACGESYSNSTPILYSIFALSESNGEVKWSRQDFISGEEFKAFSSV